MTALIRMVRAWSGGRYKDVPAQTIVLAIAAIIYFVSPIDLIPDAIPVVGFIDDAAVVAFVLKSIRGDVDAFQRWEGQRGLED